MRKRDKTWQERQRKQTTTRALSKYATESKGQTVSACHGRRRRKEATCQGILSENGRLAP
eukprot:4919289-Pleurochrysis_carterae.AAC.1